MLESKDHWQISDSGGALDLTFAFVCAARWERMSNPLHLLSLYRSFVECGFPGEALFERGDNGFHLRAERTLDHDGVAGANGGEKLRFEIRRAIGIAAPLAGGKGVPQVAHQRATTIHEINVIGLDGVIQAGMQLRAGRPQFKHIAEDGDAPSLRANLRTPEHAERRRH